MIRHMVNGLALLVLTGTAFAQESAERAVETPAERAVAEPAAADAEPATVEGTVAAVESAAAGPDGPASGPSDGTPQPSGGPRGLAGMSILGNQETPTSLVIVPWKSSEIGNGIGVSRALDTGIHAVDRDVFMRELRYYEIRTGGGD